MSRKWKPGDVALWDRHGAVEVIYHFLGGPDFDTPEWQTAHDGGGYPITGELRPLVVIDPEDREQVGRLVKAFVRRLPDVEPCTVGRQDAAMRRALRSLIAPPKPDEPTGVGAVVEDDEGERWVRGHASDVAPWLQVWTSGDYEPRWRFWSGVPAVRVLSEGVTP